MPWSFSNVTLCVCSRHQAIFRFSRREVRLSWWIVCLAREERNPRVQSNFLPLAARYSDSWEWTSKRERERDAASEGGVLRVCVHIKYNWSRGYVSARVGEGTRSRVSLRRLTVSVHGPARASAFTASRLHLVHPSRSCCCWPPLLLLLLLSLFCLFRKKFLCESKTVVRRPSAVSAASSRVGRSAAAAPGCMDQTSPAPHLHSPIPATR